MIKTKYLRLGNYVTNNSGFTMYVVGIYEDTILLNFEGNKGEILDVKEKDLISIPITENRLLKCGFKKEPNLDDTAEFIIGDFSIQRETYRNQKGKFKNEFRYWIQHINENGIRKQIAIEIKYLHQLQNLFWCLSGKELEINI